VSELGPHLATLLCGATEDMQGFLMLQTYEALKRSRPRGLPAGAEMLRHAAAAFRPTVPRVPRSLGLPLARVLMTRGTRYKMFAQLE
jgi:hypothetical protein